MTLPVTLTMLIYQGMASFHLWTGREAPAEVMMATGRRALKVVWGAVVFSALGNPTGQG